MNKKNNILEQLILTYIEDLIPISSSYLKEKRNIEYSSSSIRIYFKELDNEGKLLQEHISSGRIPSNESLIKFWLSNFSIFENISITKENLLDLAIKNNISFFVRKNNNTLFIDIENINDKYIILNFSDKNNLLLNYDLGLFKILKSLLGNKIEEVLNFIESLNIDYNLDINKIIKQDIINLSLFTKVLENNNINNLIKLNKYFDKFLKLDNGIYFDGVFNNKYIGCSTNMNIDNELHKVFFIGEINNNYFKIFNKYNN